VSGGNEHVDALNPNMHHKLENAACFQYFFTLFLQSLSKQSVGNHLIFSIRYIASASKMSYPPRRCIYDGLLMAFQTQLDPSCRGFIYNSLTSCAIEPPRGEEKNPPPPSHISESDACSVEGFWIKFGPCPPREDPNFILTDSITSNLSNIVRAISVERFPVLLQGPTSAGITLHCCRLVKLISPLLTSSQAKRP
jgi:midasin (ATPase involved in ribosome maturation)